MNLSTNEHPLLQVLHYHYVTSAPDDTSAEKECRKTIRSHIEKLPFPQQDAILCAVNALCCECEQEAYLTGLRDGAQIFWELLR